MAGLQLTRIVRKFGTLEVICDLSLEIADGEFVVLVGPSGCGKSTLLRLIAGLDQPTSGSILIDGADVTWQGPRQRGVGMVFQSYALYPHMNARRNIGFGLEMARMARDAIDARIAAASDKLRLTDYLMRRPGELSGGQRQRVAIGRAMTRKPALFLFDEPLSNLDAALRVSMRAEIAHLRRTVDSTLIYVTHDQTEAMTLADRIVVLNEGQVSQIGAPLDLYDDPANRFVAGFIGSPAMNFLAGSIGAIDGHNAQVQLETGGALDFRLRGGAVAGQKVVVGIRPEHLRLAAEGAGTAMRIELVELLGSDTFIHVHGGPANGATSLLTIRLRGTERLSPGSLVHIDMSTPHRCLFDEDGARLA